ncbi:PH domain-containing protein [Terribacillus sp. DMT04]|uniref:PH domain-containing protein n=1 Tax=Terribacillus sp. DMT04 TaxID=2850441 RepID=UPI001C2C75D8|nr:PH domain-containing protein [Terribacillus sp. DMT04]QXE02364.1 PH domain-containing protein [Terribacillus sp. DMT04]
METQVKEPKFKLPKESLRVGIIGDIIFEAIILLIFAGLFVFDYLFEWPAWIGTVLIILLIASVPFGIIGYFATVIDHRNWRYDIDEEYVQLRQGAWFQKDQLIPVTKIQSVETKQGPLLRKYKLREVEIETMAGEYSIPGLPEKEAYALRNEIAAYAKAKEEDD